MSGDGGASVQGVLPSEAIDVDRGVLPSEAIDVDRGIFPSEAIDVDHGVLPSEASAPKIEQPETEDIHGEPDRRLSSAMGLVVSAILLVLVVCVSIAAAPARPLARWADDQKKRDCGPRSAVLCPLPPILRSPCEGLESRLQPVPLIGRERFVGTG